MLDYLAATVAVASATTNVVAYLWYNRQVNRGDSRPNLVAWTIWTTVSLLSFVTYFSLSGDWYKSFEPAVNVLVIGYTYVRIWRRGHWLKPQPRDVFAGLVAAVVLGIWLSDPHGPWANVLLNSTGLVTYGAVAWSVWRQPRLERPAPWLLWGLCNLLALAVVLVRWRGNWAEAFGPVVNTIFNGLIGLLALRSSPPVWKAARRPSGKSVT